MCCLALLHVVVVKNEMLCVIISRQLGAVEQHGSDDCCLESCVETFESPTAVDLPDVPSQSFRRLDRGLHPDFEYISGISETRANETSQRSSSYFHFKISVRHVYTSKANFQWLVKAESYGAVAAFPHY